MRHAVYEMLAFCVAKNLCASFFLKCPADAVAASPLHPKLRSPHLIEPANASTMTIRNPQIRSPQERTRIGYQGLKT